MIWIFLAGGWTGRAGIEGTLRGPRGPRNVRQDGAPQLIVLNCLNFLYRSCGRSRSDNDTQHGAPQLIALPIVEDSFRLMLRKSLSILFGQQHSSSSSSCAERETSSAAATLQCIAAAATLQLRIALCSRALKCNEDIKKSGGTRKKAIVQRNTFTLEMLGKELNVQGYAVWRNMEPTEPRKASLSL